MSAASVLVALLAEGVDRNIGAAGLADVHARRPTSTYFILAPECLGGLLNAKTAEGATIYNTAVAYPIGIIFAIAMLAVFLHATKKAAQKA